MPVWNEDLPMKRCYPHRETNKNSDEATTLASRSEMSAAVHQLADKLSAKDFEILGQGLGFGKGSTADPGIVVNPYIPKAAKPEKVEQQAPITEAKMSVAPIEHVYNPPTQEHQEKKYTKLRQWAFFCASYFTDALLIAFVVLGGAIGISTFLGDGDLSLSLDFIKSFFSFFELTVGFVVIYFLYLIVFKGLVGSTFGELIFTKQNSKENKNRARL